MPSTISQTYVTEERRQTEAEIDTLKYHKCIRESSVSVILRQGELAFTKYRLLLQTRVSSATDVCGNAVSLAHRYSLPEQAASGASVLFTDAVSTHGGAV